jgi:hypothetical protein
MKKLFFVGLLFLVILVLAYKYLNSKSTDEIIKSLPDSSKVIGVYRQGGWGNGDYVYALKVSLSESSFRDFAKLHSMSEDEIDPTTVIGFNPSPKDIGFTNDLVWDEPKNPQIKYYKKLHRSFVRAVFNNGVMHFYSRGW